MITNSESGNAPLLLAFRKASGVNLGTFGRALICMVSFLSVFQAVAIPAGEIWIPPQQVLEALLLSILTLQILSESSIKWPASIRAEFVLISLFTFYAAVTAQVFPRFFEGLYILSPINGIDDEIISPTILEPFRSHIGQPIYLILNVGLLASCATFHRPDFGRRLLSTMLLAGWAAVFFAFYQKLAKMSGIYFPNEVLYSNEGYAVGNDTTIDDFERINSVFTEASTAGNVFGAFFCFYLFEYYRTRRLKIIFPILIYLISVLLTTSSIGYLEILFALGLIMVASLKRPIVALGLLVGSLVFSAIMFASIPNIIDSVLLSKSEGGSFLTRISSDIFSFNLAQQTAFLGVGLGGNRPSSFLTFLLSNVGGLGLILFVGFVVALLRDRDSSRLPDPIINSLRAALLTFLFGKIVGVPDLSVFFLWVLIAVIVAFKIDGAAKTAAEISSDNAVLKS